VLVNLVYNAVKFTEAGGRIGVEVTADPRQGDAVLRVRDTGIGMPNHMLAHAFAPFAQGAGAAERGGVGLGLTVVRGLVELHGGRVEAASEGAGRGSELVVHLPLSRPPDASLNGPSSAGDEGRRARRVLVIEDNEDIGESIRLTLELAGHEVALASSGVEGLRLAAAFRPDIILCDIGLPGGMDGYAVARKLRGDPALSSARRVAMSGFGQEEDQRKALEAGFQQHLTKPVDPDLIEGIVNRA
jgi:CheY-like chemotaxis protein